MEPISRPTQTASECFQTCISKVKNKNLKTRFQKSALAVTTASKQFESLGAVESLHLVPQTKNVGRVTKSEMIRLYDFRMAKLGSPGREIYDEIMSSAPEGRCSLCGTRQATTLDHCLPKALYTALSVTPLNLVPACSDCNKTKLNLSPGGSPSVLLHPYFDDIDNDRWLFAEVLETYPVAMRFAVSPTTPWSKQLRTRVQHHFDALKLSKLYATKAAEELSDFRHQFSSLSKDDLRSELLDRASSCHSVRRNGWRTAAYYAWAESDWFCSGGFIG